MVLAIKPMENVGKPGARVLDDKWTAVTEDGSFSAHFEHCIAVTKDGPLVLTAATQFRVAPPPPRYGLAYTRAFNEVKTVGGDNVSTLAVRTPDQTVAAVYWGYDGTPGLGTPPRMYNPRIPPQLEYTDYGFRLARERRR